MPQAIVDPEELRRFARNLHRFNTEVQDRLSSLSTQLSTLGRTWRDQEQKKFSEEFEQQMKSISRFVEMTEGRSHVDYAFHLAPMMSEHIDEIDDLIDTHGVTSFKIFMFYCAHGLHGRSDDQSNFLMKLDL